MSTKLNYHKFENFRLSSGQNVSLRLSYQTFGLKLGKAPLVVVNHSLTGDSNISGDKGWWSELIGSKKMIDTNKFCVMCINIPGNIKEKRGFNYGNKWILHDVAKLFVQLLKNLGVKKVHSLIGGSIGGGLVWEMGLLDEKFFENLIPVAADYKASDWLISNTYFQNLILKNSKNPIFDARVHAMLSYRNPKSINRRFKIKSNDSNERKVIDWLNHHGNKLKQKFSLNKYIHMNNLLSSIGYNYEKKFLKLITKNKSNIHLVGVNSDLLFPNFEIENTYDLLSTIKRNIYYYQIQSDHGHDAFLIEFKQMKNKLNHIFEN